MNKKQKSALEQLNVALAGIEAVFSVLEVKADSEVASIVQRGKHHAERAREHLLTIQFHIGQL